MVQFFSVSLKTGGDGFLGLASKPRVTVFQFRPQNQQLRFDYLGLKIIAMVSWFGPQNYAGFGLSVAPQNRRREDDTRQALRSGGLLRLEVSRARVSQSGYNTGRGATTGGARGIIIEVTSRES
jgi:hypothetical protein